MASMLDPTSASLINDLVNLKTDLSRTEETVSKIDGNLSRVFSDGYLRILKEEVADLIKSLGHAGTVVDSIEAKIRVKIEEPEIDVKTEPVDVEELDDPLYVEVSPSWCNDNDDSSESTVNYEPPLAGEDELNQSKNDRSQASTSEELKSTRSRRKSPPLPEALKILRKLSEQELTEHEFGIDPEVTSAQVHKPYSCETCHKRFLKLRALRRHVRHNCALLKSRNSPITKGQSKSNPNTATDEDDKVVQNEKSKANSGSCSPSESSNNDNDKEELDQNGEQSPTTVVKPLADEEPRKKPVKQKQRIIRNSASTELSLTCPNCGKVTKNQQAIKYHMKQGCKVAPVRHRRSECVKCGESYGDNVIARHTKTCFGEPGPPYHCKICKKIIKNRFHWHLHMKCHSGEKEFKCTFCDYASARKSILEVHMRTHSEEKKYKCDLCPSMYKHLNSLITHKSCSHSTNSPTHQCTQCGMMFKLYSNLQRHISNVHDKVRPYSCHLCDKSFKAKPHLEYHLKTHSNPNAKKRGLNLERDELEFPYRPKRQTKSKKADDSNVQEPQSKHLQLTTIEANTQQNPSVIEHRQYQLDCNSARPNQNIESNFGSSTAQVQPDYNIPSSHNLNSERMISTQEKQTAQPQSWY